MIVLDASAWVTALVDSGSAGEECRRVIGESRALLVPPHSRLEVTRTLARLEIAGRLDEVTAAGLFSAALELEVREVPADPGLLRAVWRVRHNLSVYDAPYVVLALGADARLLTCDKRLARATTTLGAAVVLVD